MELELSESVHCRPPALPPPHILPCTSPSLPPTAGLHLELERQSARLQAELSALHASSQTVIAKLQADLQVMPDEAESAWPM